MKKATAKKAPKSRTQKFNDGGKIDIPDYKSLAKKVDVCQLEKKMFPSSMKFKTIAHN